MILCSKPRGHEPKVEQKDIEQISHGGGWGGGGEETLNGGGKGRKLTTGMFEY